jgi:hypothetical protein
MSSPPPFRSYRGNCHCGAFVYTLRCPEITTVLACNCSICAKRAYCDWVLPDDVGPGEYAVVRGSEDDLVAYAFGKREWEHLVSAPGGGGGGLDLREGQVRERVLLRIDGLLLHGMC